jgi:hypothetical protein
MNYTVKQGGNKQHASVYEFIRNTEFDTWGFWGKAPITDPVTNITKMIKPIEHSNEYGINLSGPLVPLGKWKEKVFYFGNYNGFRYSASTPTPLTFPTPNQQIGNFTQTGTFVTGTGTAADDTKIYDPSTVTTCASHNTGGYPCRYQYGYGPPTSGTGANGLPTLTGAAINVIPSGQFSAIAQHMQSYLPTTGISAALSNNYMTPNTGSLINWSTTDRIDFLPTSSDTLTFIFADGRQASAVPQSQTTAGRNTGPVPYNFGQAFAPKTAVGIIEETHVFTPHLINQIKWGYARYNGPTWNPSNVPAYNAAHQGITYAGVTYPGPTTSAVSGPAVTQFPSAIFTGGNGPTTWGGGGNGSGIPNVTIAQNYTGMDNLQWTVGKHSFTFGGQVAWMLANTNSAVGGTTPLLLTNQITETESLAGTANNYNVGSGGQPYASFLIGQIDTVSLTDYSAHPEYGARFRAISPYVQDNWKVSSKLTLDLGLRYDFFPSVREVNDKASFFDPNLANPITSMSGALNFTGHGAGTCNCDTPVKNYYRNFGPRVGAAYQLNSKTIIRSSYGVMYTHGDAVGGLTSTLGTLGFSAAPSWTPTNAQTTMTTFLNGGSGVVPTYAGPLGVASGAGYGTGYTSNSSYAGAPSASTYDDPYLGGRAPEYINWTFGIQRQVTSALAVTATYVGSEGHFLQLDSYTARGYQSNQLDPKYLVLAGKLADTGSTVTGGTGDCSSTGAVVAAGFTCPASALAVFGSSKPTLANLLSPFPFEAPADSFGYVGNANYHGLQTMANMRAWKGLTLNANFTYSRIIDDGGTFRSGYAIPAGTLANHPTQAWKADRIERTVSTSSQKMKFVLTSVWDWPLGKTILNSQPLERAIFGGFKFSGVWQQYTGSPLAITENTAPTNPSQQGKPAYMNPNFIGQSARQNGRWGKGATTSNYTTISYIVPAGGTTVANATGPFLNTGTSAIKTSMSYLFGDAPRTAPYNLTGPGNFQLDLAMVRSFPLHITPSTKLNFRAEWYNVTNHTLFAVASTAVGAASFGQVTASGVANRKAAQFSARIEF